MTLDSTIQPVLDAAEAIVIWTRYNPCLSVYASVHEELYTALQVAVRAYQAARNAQEEAKE